MPPQSQQPPAIPNTTAVFMVSVAIFYDALEAGVDLLHFIPIVGTAVALIVNLFIDVLAWMTFYLWFKLRGVNFASPKRALALNGGFIADLIPILNIFAWVAAVLIIIFITRAEELLQKAGPAGALAAKALKQPPAAKR